MFHNVIISFETSGPKLNLTDVKVLSEAWMEKMELVPARKFDYHNLISHSAQIPVDHNLGHQFLPFRWSRLEPGGIECAAITNSEAGVCGNTINWTVSSQDFTHYRESKIRRNMLTINPI